MSKLAQVFGDEEHVFLPVIHVKTVEQTMRNAHIAFDNGADGIFLIGHGLIYNSLNDIYHLIREHFGKLWIGINYLDRDLYALDFVPDDVNALWSDNAQITDRGISNLGEKFYQERQKRGWYTNRGLYFGGVAFKYQTPVIDIFNVAKMAVPYVDVVTTSGDKTGEPPSASKIHTMRQAIGNHPLAIASGMTPENVRNYLDDCDCFLVSTGISKSFHEFDAKAVKAFSKSLGK